MSFHEIAIPLLSIVVPIVLLFIVRGLDKGEKKRQRLHLDMEELDARIRKVENDMNRLLGRMNSH